MVAPTVATVVLLLDHVPPPGRDDKVVLLPVQIPVVPVIAEGPANTENTAVDTHVPPNE